VNPALVLIVVAWMIGSTILIARLGTGRWR
jgi:hypothetical protein